MPVEIKGVPQLKAKLDELEGKVAKQYIRQALRAGAKVIAATCRSTAPVETGATRDAIKVRSGKRSRGRVSMAVQIGKAWFRGKTFYAGFVEFGWRPGARRASTASRLALTLGRHVKVGAARPLVPGKKWLHRAFEASADNAIGTIVSTLKGQLEGKPGAEGGDA